jgi:mono/diheme cytochrome c family protein
MRLSYVLPAAATIVAMAAAYPTAQSRTTTPIPTTAQPGTTAASVYSGPIPVGNAEHGRYLAEHVAMCVECHSGRDGAGNILQSERYLGAPIPFGPPWAEDWASRAPRNQGLPGYSDAMAMRLLTQGAIGRDGHQLKMPMPRFRMTPQDAADVIAWMRSAK